MGFQTPHRKKPVADIRFDFRTHGADLPHQHVCDSGLGVCVCVCVESLAAKTSLSQQGIEVYETAV